MPNSIRIRTEPCNVNYVNRIMEGYEYLGVVTTIDRSDGLLMIRATPDTAYEVRQILTDLPVKIEFEMQQ
ncbi:MAG: hypothetical protein H6Q66_1799 [Firmicutes bacterium]|nr:hypothetical protein [Bacillota bacterium]